MIFSPELAAKVLDGTKTITRRRVRVGDFCRYLPGQVYAVQPGRGKKHVGHIAVWGLSYRILNSISDADVRSEGFVDIGGFMDYWMKLYGVWNPNEEVSVIEFILAPSCERCVPLQVAL